MKEEDRQTDGPLVALDVLQCMLFRQLILREGYPPRVPPHARRPGRLCETWVGFESTEWLQKV